MAGTSDRGDRSRARTHERVEYHVVLVGEQVDQTPGELHRERRRVAYSGRALGRDLPQVGGRLEELVTRDRRGGRHPELEPLPRSDGPIEPTLARDDDPLGDVPQHRVARSLERSPGTRATRRAPLPPDHLAAQQEPEVLEDLADIAGQRAVGPSTEVGHVDGDAPARLEDPPALDRK